MWTGHYTRRISHKSIVWHLAPTLVVRHFSRFVISDSFHSFVSPLNFFGSFPLKFSSWWVRHKNLWIKIVYIGHHPFENVQNFHWNQRNTIIEFISRQHFWRRLEISAINLNFFLNLTNIEWDSSVVNYSDGIVCTFIKCTKWMNDWWRCKQLNRIEIDSIQIIDCWNFCRVAYARRLLKRPQRSSSRNTTLGWRWTFTQTSVSVRKPLSSQPNLCATKLLGEFQRARKEKRTIWLRSESEMCFYRRRRYVFSSLINTSANWMERDMCTIHAMRAEVINTNDGATSSELDFYSISINRKACFDFLWIGISTNNLICSHLKLQKSFCLQS